jgi:HEPN domain-containing protein
MKDYEKCFRKAENDLLNIKNNLSSENVPSDTCCFHAQQAVEKYLKAYLISRNIIFPKTNDLKYLLKSCTEINNNFFNNTITRIFISYLWNKTPLPG